MANVKTETLLRDLFLATSRGEVKWGETTASNSFRVGLGGGMVRITQDRDSFSISFLSPEGRELDRVSDGETGVPLDSLFNAARRSALDVDTLIDAMAVDLKGGKAVKPPREDDSGTGEDIPF